MVPLKECALMPQRMRAGVVGLALQVRISENVIKGWEFCIFLVHALPKLPRKFGQIDENFATAKPDKI